MTDEPNRVEIHDVRTDVVVTEGVGPLSKGDVQRLVSLVLEHLRQEQDRNASRDNATTIENRVFPAQGQ